MKKLIFASFAAMALFAACKSNKDLTNATTVAAEAPAAEDTATFEVTEPAAPATAVTPTEATSTTNTSTYEPSTNVRTQSEEFAFDSTSDANLNSDNSYFVIVGSFSSLANANRYKAELAPKGFSAIVLHSDTGYYRVCVNSYATEQSARVRISQIRSEFPEYADCWLLVKK
ncbi:MAG: SPOR domain-containing protein [Mangrovibacterium sp.]